MSAALVLLLLALCVVASHAAASCDPQCTRWSSDVFTAQALYIPCNLAVTGLHVIAGADEYHQSGASSSECTASGSGTQLTITVPTGEAPSAAVLVWTYADGNETLVCDHALRSAAAAAVADLRLLGFSISVQSGMLHAWEHGGESCPAAVVVVRPEPLAEPQCYTNEGAPSVLQGVTNASETRRVSWRFATRLGGNAQNVSIRVGNSTLSSSTAVFSCTHNLGTSRLRLSDGVTGLWALSWNYNTYASCDEVWQSLVDGSDDAPLVESVVVVVPGDQVYSWVRDRKNGTTVTTKLSDREVDCFAAAAAPVPVPSTAPVVLGDATLPITPVVNCFSRAPSGPCVVWFGYYNPNNRTIRLPRGTDANQVVRGRGEAPEYFAPGWHNYTLRTEFACGKSGFPGASWKLRTSVPAEVASRVGDNRCADACSHDSAYDVLLCSGMYVDAWLGSPMNGGGGGDSREQVLQCARSVAHVSMPACEE